MYKLARSTMKRFGFTLIELMIVVSIIAVLAMISVPNMIKFVSRAKRSEAYMHLHALHAAQKAHWAEHGTYAQVLQGAEGLGWSLSDNSAMPSHYYTYGFSGAEGVHNIIGKLKTPSVYLQGSYADQNSFLILAAGDIDGDGTPDILSVDHTNTIRIVQDDLK